MSSKKYNMTYEGVMGWAKNELEHVGYLVAVQDPDIQYSYAQCVVNGMLHLRDALYEMVKDPNYEWKRVDLQKTHDNVVRTVKHIIKDFKVNLDDIRRFNTRRVLGSLSYLHSTSASRRSTRRNNRT